VRNVSNKSYREKRTISVTPPPPKIVPCMR